MYMITMQHATCCCVWLKVLYTPMPVIWMQPVDVSTFRTYPH